MPLIDVRALVITTLVCLTGPSASAAQPAAADPFARVASLVGAWTGTVEGEPGTGTARRTYERVMNDRYIRVRNESTYPAQAKNPKGEVHHDEGYISLDRSRKLLVLRQFHVEGFVNQYAQRTTVQSDRVVFESEAIENIPAGWRARETYVFNGADAFEEIFELAEPGQEFAVYSHTRFTRTK